MSSRVKAPPVPPSWSELDAEVRASLAELGVSGDYREITRRRSVPSGMSQVVHKALADAWKARGSAPTQRELAKVLKVHPRTLNDWLAALVELGTVKKIARGVYVPMRAKGAKKQ